MRLRMGAVRVWFDVFGDSEGLVFLSADNRLLEFFIRQVTFTDGREPLYYTVDGAGEPTSPAMPAIAMQALLDAREARVSEYLKTLH